MSRLRAGLELTVLELDRGGTARAARALAHGLAAREDVDLVTFAHGGPLRAGGTHRAAAGGGVAGGGAAGDGGGPGAAGARRAARGLARELAWLPLELPRRVRRARLDVLHCPSPLVPIVPGPTPLVVTVHDLLAWEDPEWMSRANVLQQRLVLRRVLPRAAVVLTSSRFTRGALLERFGLAPERVVVVPLAVDPIFSPGPDGGVAGVAGPYLVALGTLQPRKDLEAALAAFEHCAAAGAPHALVVVGGHGWRDSATLARLRASRHAARIHLLGHVGDGELVRAVRGADALLFPSRHEGFGLPPLEAMACGTPVVAVRATAVPEVVGDAAVLAEPGDPRAFAGAVAALLGDPARRADLRERGLRHAAEFTQARTTELTVAAYRRAVEASPAR